jgi:hypothetical protein
VDGGDVAHLHRTELRDQVLVDLVAVALAGGVFQLMVREPHADDVGAEGDLSSAGVVSDPEQGVGFGGGPRAVGCFPGPVGAGGAADAAGVFEIAV